MNQFKYPVAVFSGLFSLLLVSLMVIPARAQFDDAMELLRETPVRQLDSEIVELMLERLEWSQQRQMKEIRNLEQRIAVAEHELEEILARRPI